MVVLSAVALPLAFSSRLRLQVTASVGHGTQALYLAKAGVERVLADLGEGRESIQMLDDLRESELNPLHNVELGPGTYTLFAGYESNGDPSYGLIDECAKINVGTADQAVLAKLPGMSDTLASELVAQRGRTPFNDLNDLLLLERMSTELLFGEDANGNGVLDGNENDGSASWPQDNADGRLDPGLSAYLTAWSSSRNVTSTGGERVNINSASANDITKSVSGVSKEQAESIVEHRKKKKFANIVELLDVKIVKKVTQKSEDKNKSSDNKENTVTQTTDKNAFDENAFRKIADAVTTTDDKVRRGVVNLNTASEEVLACLPGISKTLAASIRQAREKREDGFQSVADLLDVEGVSTEILKQLCSHVSVRSDVFSLWSYGVTRSGNIYRCVHAVVDRTESVSRIRYWRELE